MKSLRFVGQILVAAALGNLVLSAQQAPAVKRNILLKEDLRGVAGRETILALVELPPGSAEGRHTHFAEVYGFVQEGEVTLENEGFPTATLKVGDHFHIVSGAIHQAINHGKTMAKLAAVFIAEKGKPLTTPIK